MGEIEETAKATQEVAKLGQKALDSGDKVGNFISNLIKEPLKEASGMITDKLKIIRYKRQVRMVDEVNKMLEAREITETKPVPLKLAIPLVENASIEEDNNLQDLWNKLIVNAMDSGFENEIRYSYIEIIKSLTSLDANFLRTMYNSLLAQNCNLDKISDYSLKKEQLCDIMKINMDDCIISIYNLFRVQCLAPAVLKMGGISSGGESPSIYKGVDQVTMTPLGRRFVEACIK